MSGINNEYNEQEIAGSVTAGTSMFSDLFRRFGQPPMVVPEADEECRTYYQEILHIKAQLEQIDASNRGIDRIVVNADGTLTVYYSDGTTYTSPSLKGADGQDGQDGAPGQDGQDGADGQDGQDGAPGRDGVDGQDGVTPNITVTATVDNTPGTAGVTVTKSGTDANPIFAFNFVHVKGETGAQGQPGQNGVSPTAYVTQTGQNEVTFTVIDGNGTTTATLTGEAGAPGRDGQDGQDGEDGVSPVITVTDITGGHRVTISDADGTQSFDVMDGTDGQNGQNGTDGVSPTVTVTDITGGHQVSITDASSTQTFNVMNGADGRDGTNGTNGTDGVSPTIDVVTITGGHRVDITDAQGSESFTVMDGTPGQNGQDGVTPDITMTATADATSSANPTVTVTKGGTTANPTFALAFSGLKGEQGIQGIQGVQGVQGETGATGATGPAGPGVPTGGTAGQVLAKVDGTDYNTEWVTPESGGAELLLEATGSSVNLLTLFSSLGSRVNTGDLLYITLGSDTVAPLGSNVSVDYKVLSIPWSSTSLSWGSQAKATAAAFPNLWRVVNPTSRWHAVTPYPGYNTEGVGDVTEMSISTGQSYVQCRIGSSMFTPAGQQLKINSMSSGDLMRVQMVTGPIKVWRLVKAA